MLQTTIQPYLFFGGRCEEAIAFYKKGLGAEVDMLMRHRESPTPPPPGTLQPGFEDKVMHAAIRIGGAILLMSDGCGETAKFDGFGLSLSLPSEEAARRAFAALSDGGKIQMPMAKTFWSACFGMVADRFNVNWMVMVAEASAG